ncbi:tetratricopeptide repeat protein [Edaphobacter aggregans]|uniref:tetratricopeptide repeat protein n=1 Tax=Edaphobacter aggregans TaxID=570835 RepID=UPI00054EB7B7|nr:tetratricopeptide repeat protein [Edaphobacter aggregans]
MQLLRIPTSLSIALLACVLYLPSLHALSPQENLMKITSDAEHGSLSAEIELGARYMTGDGVPRDLTAAAHWYEKAAQRGEPNAQNQIGYFYQAGIGVPQDLGRAMHWYQLSAANGDASALVNMGVLYITGTGVKKDVAHAASIFENAARKGNGTAAAYLGDIYYFGLLGPADIAAAEKWFEAGARMHDPIAAYNLGSLYSVDPAHPHDTHKAVSLMRRSTADGYVPAIHSLALLLINHPQEEQTSGEARSLLETASAAGEWKSSIILGILARDGRGVPVDKRAADVYFHVALLQGGKPAGDLLMKDLATLDAIFDAAQREAILREAQAWYTQHSQSTKFIAKNIRAQKLFPLPQSTDIIRDNLAPGQTAQTSAKEAPCTITHQPS